MPLFFDSTMILLVPALLLSLYAQSKVSGTFNKYSGVAAASGLTGMEVAKRLLSANGINDVKVEHVSGNLTDHYDPRDKTVRLSDAVYNKRSLAAIGVAAHEVGHAIQHNQEYGPLALRSGLFPVVNFGSKLSMPLLMLGLFMGYSGFGMAMLYAGIALFSTVVLFQLVTLPVEFNASSRAIDLLEQQHILSGAETGPTKKVLDAAALTYVAAAVMSLMQLLRFIMIARGRR